MPPSDALTNDSRPSIPGETTTNVSSRDARYALRKTMMLLQAKVRSRTLPCNCFLDEQPSERVPLGALQRMRLQANDAKLVVNPSFHYQDADDPPEEIAQRALPLGGFLRGHPVAWVKDPGVGLWMPFWARGEWADVLRSLEPGGPAPSFLRPAMRNTLAAANVFVPDDYGQSRQAQWVKICEIAQSQFRTQGYAVVRDLVHPFQLGAMRRYYRELVAGGGLPLGDFQVAQRYQLGNEVLASFFHPQLATLVSRIAAEPVKPSYVYLASYRPGADLQRHVDREQCEFSISLLVDYMPDPDGPCGWPLFMENPAAPEMVHAADLGIGDALIYRGRELIHYRQPLPEGHQSTSFFLHYVREDFAGRLW